MTIATILMNAPVDTTTTTRNMTKVLTSIDDREVRDDRDDLDERAVADDDCVMMNAIVVTKVVLGATIETFKATTFSTLPQLDDLNDRPGSRSKGKEIAKFVTIVPIVVVVLPTK